MFWKAEQKVIHIGNHLRRSRTTLERIGNFLSYLTIKLLNAIEYQSWVLISNNLG